MVIQHKCALYYTIFVKQIIEIPNIRQRLMRDVVDSESLIFKNALNLTGFWLVIRIASILKNHLFIA